MTGEPPALPIILQDIEQALTDCALTLVNSLARACRVSPHHFALEVPGLCHTHAPDGRPVDGCLYCARRGTCFGR